ncbi:nitrous oxide reductase accessory protein NosL [Flavobacterium sp. HXWNR29]|jgi:copper chaperone NosL|uniref:nitrous oxide reductase accessory protein NosL n=1 Tax=Flavobacterium odoriferum TaxID=2946604 RepID=UPI0021CB4EFC|nr:nitrous oxide reductase accessory protein NosL [Flavobacterium sp. HXWNR29]MCU4188862.1 nitrous oxide reductase accessory protein NosL [Flavobacterium sp. HXWNR29]
MKRLSYILILFLSISCTTKEADPIKLNSDGCDFCKMKIADGKFGAELITTKGRIYKFDDIHCMINYHKENLTTNIQSFYIHDFNQNNVLIPAENAFYVKGGEISSPMRGNIIAVKTEEEAKKIALKYNANPISWSEIIK